MGRKEGFLAAARLHHLLGEGRAQGHEGKGQDGRPLGHWTVHFGRGVGQVQGMGARVVGAKQREVRRVRSRPYHMGPAATHRRPLVSSRRATIHIRPQGLKEVVACARRRGRGGRTVDTSYATCEERRRGGERNRTRQALLLQCLPVASHGASTSGARL